MIQVQKSQKDVFRILCVCRENGEGGDPDRSIIEAKDLANRKWIASANLRAIGLMKVLAENYCGKLVAA